jgi:ketosteroid isomerase-like protein
MHPNAETIQRFYTAFQHKNGHEMASCYHRDIHFSDEVFTNLRGAAAGAMWRMLLDRAEDLRVEFRNVEADDRSGRAHWEAWYTFSRTGRPVHNVIHARFEFRSGKIVRHRDSFNFWKWSRQAFGPVGLVLGWSPLVKRRARREAAKNLQRFVQRAGALTS